jgi:large subunit ribosomal protein L25
MADTLTLEAQPREARGRHLRRLRRLGNTPIHIYGRGLESIAAQVATPILRRVVIAAGHNSPVMVTYEGSPHFTFIREIQKDPVTSEVLHIDFLQVDASVRMQSQVTIRLEGEAPAVRLHRGEISFNLRDVTVECLPTEVPNELVVDISGMVELGSVVHVSEIKAPAGVTIITDPEEVIVRMSSPTVPGAIEEGAPTQPDAPVATEAAEDAEASAEKE